MAFNLTESVTEIRILDQRSGTMQSLFARDATPKEQLAYQREMVGQQGGRIINRVRQTRLKFGCLVLERAQPAATPQDEGYGFERGGMWVPLTPEVEDVGVEAEQLEVQYAQSYGADWARWIGRVPAWKRLLLAKAPSHLEQVGLVVFEGAQAAQRGVQEAVEAAPGETAPTGEEPLGN